MDLPGPLKSEISLWMSPLFLHLSVPVLSLQLVLVTHSPTNWLLTVEPNRIFDIAMPSKCPSSTIYEILIFKSNSASTLSHQDYCNNNLSNLCERSVIFYWKHPTVLKHCCEKSTTSDTERLCIFAVAIIATNQQLQRNNFRNLTKANRLNAKL